MTTLLSVGQVAALLNISKSKIYQMVERRNIPHIRLGSRILFQEELLESWIRDKVVQVQAGRV